MVDREDRAKLQDHLRHTRGLYAALVAGPMGSKEGVDIYNEHIQRIEHQLYPAQADEEFYLALQDQGVKVIDL